MSENEPDDQAEHGAPARTGSRAGRSGLAMKAITSRAAGWVVAAFMAGVVVTLAATGTSAPAQVSFVPGAFRQVVGGPGGAAGFGVQVVPGLGGQVMPGMPPLACAGFGLGFGQFIFIRPPRGGQVVQVRPRQLRTRKPFVHWGVRCVIDLPAGPIIYSGPKPPAPSPAKTP